jgi:hypothetical protein
MTSWQEKKFFPQDWCFLLVCWYRTDRKGLTANLILL